MIAIRHSEAARRRRQGGGFTLIELLVVLVLVAVMAGVAIPAMSTIGTGRAGMAARQIHKDVSYARQRALATGATSWVQFDPGAGEWIVLAEDPASPGRAGATAISDAAAVQPTAGQVGTDEFAGVAISGCDFAGGVEVGFDWLGRPLSESGNIMTAAGAVTVTGGWQVEVAGRTGTVSLRTP